MKTLIRPFHLLVDQKRPSEYKPGRHQRFQGGVCLDEFFCIVDCRGRVVHDVIRGIHFMNYRLVQLKSGEFFMHDGPLPNQNQTCLRLIDPVTRKIIVPKVSQTEIYRTWTVDDIGNIFDYDPWKHIPDSDSYRIAHDICFPVFHYGCDLRRFMYTLQDDEQLNQLVSVYFVDTKIIPEIQAIIASFI